MRLISKPLTRNPNTMTILKTQRLLLQEVQLTDAPFIFELLNTPTWLKYIGDRGIKNLADAEQYIQKSFRDSYKSNGFGLYKMVLKASKQPIGLCGLVNRPSLEDIDIGFALLPKFAKQGYAYEAANATMDYAWNQLNLTTIVAITSKENTNSQQLLEKIGLQLADVITLEGDEEELLLYKVDA